MDYLPYIVGAIVVISIAVYFTRRNKKSASSSDVGAIGTSGYSDRGRAGSANQQQTDTSSRPPRQPL